ncbi:MULTISPECIES: thioredoxin family protein [Desulfococcus]|uniref:Thioredoxin domain-containing protein n=1 Tax=Desulfococcus multivorans DSM 2059 TaxID=1121405 RepID=S7T9H5_DESML|nr:thioredoxin domain-containing protein [Desulfococcus multivorans]AQV03066.1 thiol reductase thioredoxin [Desulfococcus multivorans]EPR33205.1 Thioredoxin domain-containing protein [Desulfococcus multivorans DSM 2059]MDX9817707.1 thioredoxin domain-containing protein [Desulfococcus multivorans]SKA23822.1 thioredoxin 1 [Desulfococcus multivorans DSM 2059]
MNQRRKLVLMVFVCIGSVAIAFASPTSPEVPVKGMVTMIDLGASECIPCKLMAPILDKLKKTYDGRAAIVFIDVWEDQSQAKKYGLRAIPTQIFFDESGKEVFRNIGFMSEEAIVAQLKKMGVN